MKPLLITVALLSMATPAFAKLSEREHWIYVYGSNYGMLVNDCLNTVLRGHGTMENFRQHASHIKNKADMEAAMWQQIVDNFRRVVDRHPKTLRCYQTIRDV